MRRIHIFMVLWAFFQQGAQAQVNIIGQMRDVMWKGELQGKIRLDTLQNKTNVYGLGPLAYLAGEILLFDGKSYASYVTSDSSMKVEENFFLTAPFFGYARVSKWKEVVLPESVLTLQDLEVFLDQRTKNAMRPFLFKLEGTVEQALIHVVNLPKGTKVSSPAEAHQGQVNFHLHQEPVDILGFFSTEHKAIFTHHDTYLHLHLLTKDKQKMGHLDEVKFKKGEMRLYLPAD
jgi:acetolactate decarboxylase